MAVCLTTTSFAAQKKKCSIELSGYSKNEISALQKAIGIIGPLRNCCVNDVGTSVTTNARRNDKCSIEIFDETEAKVSLSQNEKSMFESIGACKVIVNLRQHSNPGRIISNIQFQRKSSTKWLRTSPSFDNYRPLVETIIYFIEKKIESEKEMETIEMYRNMQ